MEHFPFFLIFLNRSHKSSSTVPPTEVLIYNVHKDNPEVAAKGDSDTFVHATLFQVAIQTKSKLCSRYLNKDIERRFN